MRHWIETDLAVVVETRVGGYGRPSTGVLLRDGRETVVLGRRQRRRSGGVVDIRGLRTIADLIHDAHLKHLSSHVTHRYTGTHTVVQNYTSQFLTIILIRAFLADRTIGRAYGTVCRLSVCRLSVVCL